jgi:murein DD-endopeptidase MepM/ murein hydrolase activator NlpD
MKRLEKFIAKNGWQLLLIGTAFLTVGVFLNISMQDFQANLFLDRKSAPFDGTVMPVKKVPSWIDLQTSEWKLPYAQIPLYKFIDIPDYVPSQLIIPTASLNYKNAADRATRNAQVTFSTPYMGDYKLDGIENAGSHLAVDIKIPMGTPVYAIANGVVVKAKNEPSGFGFNVVLRHDDVPSADNPTVKTTYFSGYAHMSSYSVSEGDLVLKGQLIGMSGESGTATTPHLHFQIDNAQAPWHPYWPYTSKEASDAGLDFWSAVNAGLGKDKALATTINPLVYVQKYRNFAGSGTLIATSSSSSSSSSTSTSTSTTTTTTSTTSNVVNTTPDQLPPSNDAAVTPTTPVNVVTQPTIEAKPSVVLADLQLKYDDSFTIGAPSTFKVIALDSSGNVIKDFKPAQEVDLTLENGSGTLEKSYLTASDFSDGVAEFTLTPTAGFGIRVKVANGVITKTSEVIQQSLFKDIAQSDQNYVAVNFLKNNDVVRGYPDGTFKPDNSVSRVEALKFIYEGLNKEVRPLVVLEFKDTDSKAWYARYIASAQNDGIVKGYDGNLFKPADTVTRAEFIKMLVEASGMDGKGYPVDVKPYQDVDTSAWYASYITLAKDKNLLDSSSNLIRPNEKLSRGEVAQMLYRIIVMKASGKFKYDRTLVVNNDLVDQYYSKFE